MIQLGDGRWKKITNKYSYLLAENHCSASDFTPSFIIQNDQKYKNSFYSLRMYFLFYVNEWAICKSVNAAFQNLLRTKWEEISNRCFEYLNCSKTINTGFRLRVFIFLGFCDYFIVVSEPFFFLRERIILWLAFFSSFVDDESITLGIYKRESQNMWHELILHVVYVVNSSKMHQENGVSLPNC